MSKTVVVLSTFNGERFLGEQLESLRLQSHSDWELLVRDDGSTDRTSSLLDRFMAMEPLTRELTFDGRRLGPSQSFGSLLEEALRRDAEQVFLCDQDDVWSASKMERQLARLKEAESRLGRETPLLVHSDLEVVDERLQSIHPSFLASQRLKHVERRAIATLAVQNFVTGCTILINRAALDVALPIPPQAVMHDWWISLCIAGTGRILFEPAATVKYRQHASNAVGARHYWKAIWKTIRRRMESNGWSLREKPAELIDVLNQASAAAERLGDFNPAAARWLAEFVDLWRQPILPGKRLAHLRRLQTRRLDPLRQLLLQTRLALAAPE